MELSDLLSDQLVSFCGDLDTDDDIDAIFAAAFDILQQSGPASTSIIHAETTEPTSSTPTANCNVNARFAPPKTDDEIKQLRSKGIPKKTLEDTHYCMKVWEQWCNYARQTGRDIPPIQTMQQTKPLVMLPFPATFISTPAPLSLLTSTATLTSVFVCMLFTQKLHCNNSIPCLYYKQFLCTKQHKLLL